VHAAAICLVEQFEALYDVLIWTTLKHWGSKKEMAHNILNTI